MAEVWNAPIEISPREQFILKHCKKQKLWGFLRTYRHQLLDDAIRQSLSEMYANDPRGGHPPLPPERLALAMLLQAGFGVADHEVPTLTLVDQRWQMVLDCLDTPKPAFSQGTVFSFRERARKSGLVTLLLNKTIELARSTKGFDHKQLRAIFDSSPLAGAGRVEDTFNLLGRAIKQLLESSAAAKSLDASALAKDLDLTIFGASSVKAALDIDWRDIHARADALRALVDQFDRLRDWLHRHFEADELAEPPLSDQIATVTRIIEQDTEPDPNGPEGTKGRRIRDGVAPDRLISLSDRDQRHGRKSSSRTFNGYKRHIAVDADVPGLIHAVVVQAGNQREHAAVDPLMKALDAEGKKLTELHIDRGYLPADRVMASHREGIRVISKPPTPQATGLYSKEKFTPDYIKKTLTCPAGVTIPLRLGKPNQFPGSSCGACEQKSACTSARRRTVQIHAEEQWYREMAAELGTPSGRAARRERISVEHTLAHLGAIQGRRARYRGLQKNQFDGERAAVVNNCYVLDSIWRTAA